MGNGKSEVVIREAIRCLFFQQEIRMNFIGDTLKEGSKRWALFFSTLLVISVFTFLLVKISPGDPAVNYLRASNIAVTDETVQNARVKLGLDRPLGVQYASWLWSAVRGDLGESYLKKEPVSKMIKEAVLPTFQLGAMGFVLLLVSSLFLGISSALKHDRKWDALVQAFSFACVSVPTFWLGYILLIIFALKLKWPGVFSKKGLAPLVLPAITLITPLVGQTSLLIRKTLMEQMSQAHVGNAILRGVKKKYVVFNHLLRNSAIPIITVFSSNILYLITGSVLVEAIFARRGVGRLFVDAVQSGDIPVIQGSLLLFGVLAIAVNALTQRVVHYLDPHSRIHVREGGCDEK